MSKTPVSLIEEHAAKYKQAAPKFEMIESVLDGQFRYSVTYCGIAAVGTGRSKREAKHKSAEGLLSTLGEIHCVTRETPDTTNYVGTLGEYCAGAHIPLPVYNESPMRGPSHAPYFDVICQAKSFTEKATAPTKKLGKQLAAQKVLQKIRNAAVAPAKPALAVAPVERSKLELLTHHQSVATLDMANSKILQMLSQRPQEEGRLQNALSVSSSELIKAEVADQGPHMTEQGANNKEGLIDSREPSVSVIVMDKKCVMMNEAKQTVDKKGLELEDVRALGSPINHLQLEQEASLPGTLALGGAAPMNSIGELGELCAKKKWGAPAYCQQSIVGPSHAPCFILSCSVLNFTVTAQAGIKKVAKQLAAQKMWILLETKKADIELKQAAEAEAKGMGADEVTEGESEKVRATVMALLRPRGEGALREGSLCASRKITAANIHESLMVKYPHPPQILLDATVDRTLDNFNPYLQMQKIAKELDASVHVAILNIRTGKEESYYVHVTEEDMTDVLKYKNKIRKDDGAMDIGSSGLYTVTICVETTPINSIVFGMGATIKEAKRKAADRMILYLLDMILTPEQKKHLPMYR